MSIFFILCISAGIAAETNDFDKYSDPGDCLCDLTSNSCDEFCCCDPDCSSSFSWSDCSAESFSSFNGKYCADNTEVFRINKRRGMETVSGSSSSEKCVRIDDSAKIEGFHSLVSSVSTSTVTERVSDVYTYADSFVESLISKSSKYLVGDVVSEFSTFVPDLNGNCVLTGPGFLKDFNGTCVISGELSEICTGYLSIPSNTFNSKKFIFKDNETGTESSLASASTSYSDNTCKKALIGAKYYVTVTGLNTVSTKNITVEYTVSDIYSLNNVKILQSASVKFFTSSNPTIHSGNPGYQPLKPLNVQSGSSSNWLLLTGKSVSGQCSSSSIQGKTVNFGSNFEYSCYLSMNYNSFKSYCPSVAVSSISIFQKLLKIEKIGKWGNSDSTNPDDWVTVDKSDPDNPSLKGAICTLGKILVLDVYYANVGSLSNPQSKVVYAKLYYKTGNWVFTGSSSDQQRFLFSAFVNYIPYDTDYDPYYSKPRRDLIMPQNVLDPFRTSFGVLMSRNFWHWSKLAFVVIAALEVVGGIFELF